MGCAPRFYRHLGLRQTPESDNVRSIDRGDPKPQALPIALAAEREDIRMSISIVKIHHLDQNLNLISYKVYVDIVQHGQVPNF
jgi:hypothetical protein